MFKMLKPKLFQTKKRAISVFILSFTLSAQEITQGASSWSVAGASMGFADVWSLYNQPAQMAFLQKMSVGISYTNLFLSKEISKTAFAFAYPYKIHAFGVGYAFSGYSLYQNHQTSLAYALRLHPTTALAIKLNYEAFRFGEAYYGSTNVFFMDIALRAQPIAPLGISVHIYKPYQTKIEQKDSYPILFRLGLDYKVGKSLLCILQAEKNLYQPLAIKTGLAWQVVPIVSLRLGAGYNPTLFSTGLSVFAKYLHIDIASAWHWQLGIIPAVALRVDMGKHVHRPQA